MKAIPFFLLALLLFVSCGKNPITPDGNDPMDPTDPTDPPKKESSMTATIGPRTFVSSEALCRIIELTNSNTFSISAEAGEGVQKQEIFIFVNNYTGVGSYENPADASSNTNLFQYSRKDSVFINNQWHEHEDVWSSNADLISSGHINITKVTATHIDGNFDFSLIKTGDTLQTNNGEFHAVIN